MKKEGKGETLPLLCVLGVAMTELEIGGVTVEIVRKRVKRLNLHVTGTRVWMSVPLRCPLRDAERFVREHLDWVRAQLARAAAARPEADGTALLWGARLPLRVEERPGKPDGRRDADALTLLLPPAGGEEARKAALGALYRAALLEALPAACEKAERAVGVRAEEYRLRMMKTRWGTCSLRRRRVWLNTRLAQYPPECLDYVLAHELCHLLVPDHSAAFWREVERAYPAWRAARGLLR